MGSFAELLVEATERAERSVAPALSPFADALRVFEDRVAGASLRWAEPTDARRAPVASCVRYAAARSARGPAPSSISVAA